MLNLLRVFVVVAAGIGAYLLWTSIRDAQVFGCAPGSGCSKVLQSRWSSWFGIPVSAGALAFYAGVFASSLFIGRKTPAPTQRRAWYLLLPAALVLIGAALWFIALQVAVIHAICRFCMAAHLLGLCIGGLLLWHVPLGRRPQKPWQIEKCVFLEPGTAGKLGLAAGLAVGALVLGQSLHSPRDYVVRMFDGRIQFDRRELPVVGNPSARHLLVSLFDHRCKYCRELHEPLLQLIRPLSNELAMISLPAPLCSNCNFTVRRTHPDHLESCDFARIALAVERARPGAMPAFDDWYFKQPPALSTNQAMAHAAAMVGAGPFDKALKDPWVERQLQLGISIYATNFFRFKEGSVPQLILGTNLIAGTVNGMLSQLRRSLETQLGIKLPPPAAPSQASFP